MFSTHLKWKQEDNVSEKMRSTNHPLLYVSDTVESSLNDFPDKSLLK